MLNNKYLLTMIVAKRVKQLQQGAKPLVESKQRKPLAIALEEVKAGKVYLKEKKEPLKAEKIFDEVEEPTKVEGVFNENKEPVKSEELSDEDEKPAEIEEIFNKDEESGKSKG